MERKTFSVKTMRGTRSGGGKPPDGKMADNASQDKETTDIMKSHKRLKKQKNSSVKNQKTDDESRPKEVNNLSSSSSSSDNTIKLNNPKMEMKFKMVDTNAPNQAKYTTRDNGPFVVFAKKDKIKEVTLARDLKNAGIKNLNNIYKINENMAKIVFSDRENANKLINSQSISKDCTFFIPEMYTTAYGVIKNIETEIDLTELQENIRAEVPITSIERLKSFNPTTKTSEDTTIIKIGFRASYLPRRVILYEGLIKEVTFYLPRPMFCTSCVSYGHTKKKCRSRKLRCNVCGEELDNDNQHKCQGQNCRFCLNNHITNSRNCEERLIQIKIRNTMTTRKTTFREAKKLVAERLNIIPIDTSITNFPNLSINTARINHTNKFNEILRDIKTKHDNLTVILDKIKLNLSNVRSGHPGNDVILMEISNILLEHQNQNP